MPVSYEQILNGNRNLAQVDFTANTPLPGSAGKGFFDRCNNAGMFPGRNMDAINEWFHRFLARQGWIWNPAIPAGNGLIYDRGARLLDGVATAGECAFPVIALCLLANAPNPWGWGDGRATLREWDGAHNNGFISVHQGNLPGPTPNIMQPNGQILPGYFLWGNHKVVSHQGRYYDPNYGKSYGDISEMAAASLQLVRADVRLRDLRDYNSLFGAMRLVGLKVSDFYYSNVHQIQVCQVTGHGPLAGYYIGWGQNWKPHGFKAEWFGPYAVNPLVR